MLKSDFILMALLKKRIVEFVLVCKKKKWCVNSDESRTVRRRRRWAKTLIQPSVFQLHRG